MRRKGRALMKKAFFGLLGVIAMGSALVVAQSGTKPTAATYITDEEVKAVNALPGIDRTIKVVDIGPENFAIGVIHRGASAPAGGRGTGAGAAAGGGGGRGAAAGGGARGRGPAGRGAGGAGGASRRQANP